MWQQLRLGAACLSLVLCVLFAAFWILSYDSYGGLNGRFSPTQKWLLDSWEGRIGYTWITIALNGTASLESGLRGGLIPGDQYRDTMRRLQGKMPPEPPTFLGFHAQVRKNTWVGSIPYWFLCLATLVTAFFLKPQPKSQFSLRDLFVVTTITAIVLGGGWAMIKAILQ